MAAANMKAVKLRIKSIQNTMQITKAMELVASSKLRKAKDRADAAKPYLRTLHDTLEDIAAGNSDFTSVYTRESENEKWCYVVIAGDRGLAGGYNSNLFKRFEQKAVGTDYSVLPIGKKTVDYFSRRGKTLITENYATVADVSISNCFEMAKMLCERYRKGEFGHIALCYTEFVSMMTQTADVSSLLPLSDFSVESKEARGTYRNLILYEPNAEEVFDAIVPEYLAGLIYGAIAESVASELAARRTAMEAATDNASEMIETLSLNYNRARQASITQEITEIVAGAEEL